MKLRRPCVGDSVLDSVEVVIDEAMDSIGNFVEFFFIKCARVLRAGSTFLTEVLNLGKLASMPSNWCRSRTPGWSGTRR